MKTYLVGALGLLMLVSLCVAQPGNVPAGGADDNLDKKLESVRKQIEEFHKKEQALREEFLMLYAFKSDTLSHVSKL